MKLKHFVTLFSVGFFEGILLSALSNLAFEVFVSKSFTGYLSLFVACMHKHYDIMTDVVCGLVNFRIAETLII
jgi:hypothetical protein